MRGIAVFSLAAVLAAGCGQTAPAAPSPRRHLRRKAGVTRRLTVRGGALDGKVFGFSYHDPF